MSKTELQDLVLRSWLNNECKQALSDREKLVEFAALLKIGHERNDPPLHVIRVAIAAFVAGLIAPELLHDVDTWLDRN